LARNVTVDRGGHAFVGIHGARPLFTVLSDHGFDEVAYDAMVAPDYPGYVYTLDIGFTTWPEEAVRLEGDGRLEPVRSYNHPMQSGFAAWFHETVAGIRPDPEAPGFKHTILKPHLYRQIAWMRAIHVSPYGTLVSGWSTVDGTFLWDITLPPNTTATAHIPCDGLDSVLVDGSPVGPEVDLLDGRAVLDLPSGSYQLTSRL
jgi:alpha-L-rhamnosidase